MKKALCIIAAVILTWGACLLWLLGHIAWAGFIVFVAICFSAVGCEKEEGTEDAQ